MAKESSVHITDVLGHSLEIGDFVTAVFYSGGVSLFEVVGFKRAKCSMRGRIEDCVSLKRRFKNENISEFPYQEKLVYKNSAAITWVDPNTVMSYLLEQ